MTNRPDICVYWYICVLLAVYLPRYEHNVLLNGSYLPALLPVSFCSDDNLSRNLPRKYSLFKLFVC